MDTYCWIHSTFSIPNRYEGRNEVNIFSVKSIMNVILLAPHHQVGKDVPHPNVRPEEEGDERVYHK